MSKSILVIDTPKSCSKCPLQDMEHRVEYTGLWCYALKEPIKYLTNRVHPQCPLQDTTELLEDIGELEACAEDRYDEVAQIIANKLRTALGGEQ